MFRTLETHHQQNLISTPDHHLDGCHLTQLQDSELWHKIFFYEVVNQFDETVIEVLYDGEIGAHNAPVRLLGGMMIMKEGSGFSGRQLFEARRLNLLYRKAFGLVNITDQTPTESARYLFHRRIYAYNREQETNVVGQAFRGITPKKMPEFELDGKQNRADSVQSPYDPECSYHLKTDQKVKGYSLNLTETIGEDQGLSLITDIRLALADFSNSGLLGPAIQTTEVCTSQQGNKCYSDGAYNRSLEHQQETGQQLVEMVVSGLQGAASRFELEETDEGVQVTDIIIGQTQQVSPVSRQKNSSNQRWKIWLDDQQRWRYFDWVALQASQQCQAIRKCLESEQSKRHQSRGQHISPEPHSQRSQDPHRGLFRYKLSAWCRNLWVNMRRVCRYVSQPRAPTR